MVRGAKNISLIESQGGREASNKAIENQVNKNNTCHLEVSKSTGSGDKTAIHFHNSITKRYGIDIVKNFGSITYNDIKGEKVVTFPSTFCEI